MEFFNPNANVPFMRWGKVTTVVSIFLIIASIALVATRGLNLALDFTGGTLIEAEFKQEVNVPAVRTALDKAGFVDYSVQSISGVRQVAMRLPPLKVEGGETTEQQRQVAEKVGLVLNAAGLEATIKRSEFVGPKVGKELASDGFVAVLFVILTIMIYVAVRFEWRFGVSAIAGEIHDVIITLGFVSLTGISFDLTVLAALLTVAGYSINDKVVVFDRVREIFRSARKLPPDELINKAVNNTLSRTIMTSLATGVSLIALFLIGGPIVEGFAVTVIVGIIVGTYSSIMFCNPILLWLGISKADLQPVKREDPQLALRP